MPEPSGTGTTNQNTDDNAAAAGQQGGAGGDAAASGTPNSGGNEAARDRKLSEEAAKWRTQFRTAEQEIATLKSEIETLKKAASPGDQSSGELAQLRRTISDLTAKMQESDKRAKDAESRAKQRTLQAGLSKVVSEAKVVDPASATVILERFAEVDDDGVVVFKVKDKDGTERRVEATATALTEHKLLSDIFFPSEGVPGAGSRGPRGAAGASGIDMERARTDPDYYAKNRAAVIANLRERNRR